MASIRAKSQCCGAPIYRFGPRRRRCKRCGRTWRLRRKKRGRKRQRPSTGLLTRTLVDGQPLARQKRRQPPTVAGVRRRFRVALRAFLGQPRALVVAPAPYLLVADGVWFRFRGQVWVVYLVAVRSIEGTTATFLDPILLPGKESARGWAAALAALPPRFAGAIRAFVADDFRGAKGLAAARGWVYQRCHFHLLAQLHGRRGRRRQLASGGLREAIYRAVRALLEPPEDGATLGLVRRLRRLAAHPACPRRLRMLVREALRDLEALHAYRRHPELRLPTTTNTVEAMARIIRRVVRSVPTPEALERWVTGLVRLRPEVACNGKKIQPN